jgi:DNA-binding transcriptional ArsR family regulator
MPKPKQRQRRRRRKPLVDLDLIKALDHELRQHILLAAIKGEVSPNELSKSLGEGLSQVSYHVKVLREDCGGILKVTRTEQRRGALEHFYRADLEAVSPTDAIEQIFAMLSAGPDWDPGELRTLTERLQQAAKTRRNGR